MEHLDWLDTMIVDEDTLGVADEVNHGHISEETVAEWMGI